MSQNCGSIALIDLGASVYADALEQAVSPFRRVGRQTLLERTVRRLSESSLLDKVVIVGDNEFSGLIAQSCTQPAIWLPTDEPNSVTRVAMAADKLNAQWIVHVSATSVFVDAILIDRLLSTAWGDPECDMVAFMSAETGEYCQQGAGLAGDACHRRVFGKLISCVPGNESRSLPQLLLSMPEAFRTRLIPMPKLLEHTDLSFMLRTEIDLDRAQMILEATGEDSDFRDLVPVASNIGW